ncbi:MAG TPA: hypothetical protein VKA50_00060 [Gammaproteobacteria bacterium]|nr:hypothetical protein [Gammaproteobacteria bacterium]
MTDGSEKRELLKAFDPNWHWLVRLGQEYGPDAVDLALSEAGGTKPHLPSADNFWRQLARTVRDKEIRARFNPTTYGYGQIALELGMTERQARRIVHNEQRRYKQAQEPEKNVKLHTEPHAALAAVARRYCVPVRTVLDALVRKVVDDDELMADVEAAVAGRSGVTVSDMFEANRTNNVRESESIC